MRNSHKKDHRTSARDRRPIDIRISGVTCNHSERGCDATMCNWNTCIRWHCNGAAHTRNDLITNIRFRERLAFLPTASEDKRVAAFQTHNDLSFARFFYQQVIDFRLRAPMTRRFLTHVSSFCVKRHFIQEFNWDEAVIQKDICLTQASQALDRDQAWVARSSTDDIHDSVHQDR